MKPNLPSGQVPIVSLVSGYRGLAETIIDTLNKRGHFLSVLVRNPNAVAELKVRYPNVFFFVGDVLDKNACREWVQASIAKWGRIDCLVNNAAVTGPGGKLHEIDFKQYEDSLMINLHAPIYLTHLILPHFLKQATGTVINLSGGGATLPRPNFSAYGTAKCALVRFTESTALEYPEFRFYAISPGSLKTPMIEAVAKLDPKKIGAEHNEALRRIKEGGDDPNLAADLIFWLCENRPISLSGKVITARWDNYKKPPLPESLPYWTLRRVDGVLIHELKEKLSGNEPVN